MRSRIRLITILAVITSAGWAQNEACTKANAIVSLINQHHIQPLQLNDEWSVRVFRNFLIEIDPEKVLLTQQDFQSLQAYEKTIDDNLSNPKSCQLLSVVESLYKRKIQEHKDWITQFLSKPVEFKASEYFNVLNFPGKDFATDGNELRLIKSSKLKFELLQRMYQESSLENFQKPLTTYEPLAREKIKTREIQKLDAQIKKAGGLTEFISNCFHKSIAGAYDPHTEYFSFHNAEDFKSLLSPTQFSFGFSVQENHFGQVIITSIIPGGPAWVSNELHDGDVLMAIETAPGSIINTMDATLDEVLEQLNSNAITSAAIHVRKTDGQLKRVSLVKEKLESIENTVSGFLLKGSKNIGYIPLPSFYFDWSDEGGENRGCANDVAKAIIKLNAEKLDGLILDLRFNGGGSVSEALNLAGIFIDYGTLSLIQQPGTPIQLLKDSNKGTIFNGPIIVMVNGFSASASELLAATLQDYNRALIVGTTTFGKATGQEMFPVKPGNSTKSDFVKVTSSRIYRITGKTYQHSGVRPSVILPDLTNTFSSGESDLRFAFPADSVIKKAYYTAFPPIAFASLSVKSNERISQSDAFRETEKIRSALLAAAPLHPDGFMDYYKRITAYNPKATVSNFTVTTPSFDQSLLTVDTFKKKQTKKLLEEIEQSIYIQEAYSIMLDYIAQKNK